jgi:hypothetical protein
MRLAVQQTHTARHLFIFFWGVGRGVGKCGAPKNAPRQKRTDKTDEKFYCAREESFLTESAEANPRHSHTQNRTAKLKCKRYTEKKKRSSFYLCWRSTPTVITLAIFVQAAAKRQEPDRDRDE